MLCVEDKKGGTIDDKKATMALCAGVNASEPAKFAPQEQGK